MGRYDDIITLEHPVSKVHPRMSVMDRAAQFSAFAALSGYEDAIDETERITETYTELDEGEKEILNEQLLKIKENLESHSMTTCIYFEPDTKKEGGAYRTYSGKVRRIDEYEKKLVFEDGTEIWIDSLRDITVGPALL